MRWGNDARHWSYASRSIGSLAVGATRAEPAAAIRLTTAHTNPALPFPSPTRLPSPH
jgi:hypothetical protein